MSNTGSGSKDVAFASNKFTLDLHGVLRKVEKENIFYSPSSISVALAMTYLGAKANTATQIAKALNWDGIPAQELHCQMKSFLASVQAANSSKIELAMANRQFLQRDFDIVQHFKEGTAEFYGAEVTLVDYKEGAEGARLEVNSWVEKQTKDKIKDLIAAGVFNNCTRLTLVNAIYFKGLWRNQFCKDVTFPSQFYIKANEEVEVQMMKKTSKFRYHEDSSLECQVLEMPYDGDKLSMFFLLPHEVDGLASLEDGLTHNKLQEILQATSKSHPIKVEVSIPRFKMTQKFTLNDVLKHLGAHDMFDEEKANLTGIHDGVEKLHVSHVIHKAFVEVNEEGTEAAAATAVVIATRKCMRLPMHQIFCANHPFLFLIQEKASGFVLFFGCMIRPSSQ